MDRPARTTGEARTSTSRESALRQSESDDPQPAASTTPQIPRCATNLGTVSIQNGDSAGWTGYRLQPPAALLRVVVQQSGCFTIVERGAGLDAPVLQGLIYSPFSDTWALSGDTDVNYFAAAAKPG